MARSTCEGSTPPAAQAAPVETAIPSRSRAISSPSASTLSNDTLVVLGTRGPSPLRRAPGIASRRASSRSRRAATRTASACRLSRARAAAAPKPTTPATFSVPARRLRSWPPPLTSAAIGVPRRTYRHPTPFGP